VAESERVLPALVRRIEALVAELGLAGERISYRMTGCPNGCARPYTADIAFVGRSLGLYNVYVGGGLAGDRLVDLYSADVPQDELLAAVRPLLGRWAAERTDGEGLGDFYQRLMGLRARRTTVTGRELPTIDRIPVEVAR
jgi:sulfite reductase beta subunit-like hemoprotein